MTDWPDRATVEEGLALLGPAGRRDWPVGPLTTYRVGGAAALLVEAAAEDDLVRAGRALRVTGLPVLVVGRGSNLLVAEAGFPGLVVVLGAAYAGVEIAGVEVTVGAATSLPVLARQTAAAGLTGLEWAVGVPGSVGGGVRMNAGGHGSDLQASLRSVDLFDLARGGAKSWGVADLKPAYRSSAVLPTDVVVSARFALATGDPEAAKARISEIVRWRAAHQPGGSNAGSVFTNPEGDSAGRLVEAAGLKGRRLGTAQVSPKHANFIQSEAGGSADDVAALAAMVQAEVAERFEVHLAPELRMVGAFPRAPRRAEGAEVGP
ncbi:MAG: UDP-N-acetylmuramate dehydrogenase [Acidimicrobiales bacterium]